MVEIWKKKIKIINKKYLNKYNNYNSNYNNYKYNGIDYILFPLILSAPF